MATPVSSLYVMFNPSSGGANDQLLLVLQQLQSATPINLINMIELHQAGELTAAVVAMKTELGARLLVIGGDGTVSWALSLLYAEVDAQGAPPEEEAAYALPAVAICPGGTGTCRHDVYSTDF